MEKVMLFFGKNEYLVYKRAYEYINTFAEVDVLKYDLDETEFEEIFEDIVTDSLFSSKKIVIVNNIRKINELKEGNKEIFLRYLQKPSEDALLILIHIDDSIPDDEMFKDLIKYAYLEEVNEFNDNDLKDYIIEKFNKEGYLIENRDRKSVV